MPTKTAAAKAAKKPKPAEISEYDRTQIRNSLTGYLGSCGVYAFSGLYKIQSAAHAKAVLEEAGVRQGMPGWNTYVIAASSPSQTTEKFRKDMEAAGWEEIKEFKEAHPSGPKAKMMVLWGGYAIK